MIVSSPMCGDAREPVLRLGEGAALAAEVRRREPDKRESTRGEGCLRNGAIRHATIRALLSGAEQSDCHAEMRSIGVGSAIATAMHVIVTVCPGRWHEASAERGGHVESGPMRGLCRGDRPA